MLSGQRLPSSVPAARRRRGGERGRREGGERGRREGGKAREGGRLNINVSGMLHSDLYILLTTLNVLCTLMKSNCCRVCMGANPFPQCFNVQFISYLGQALDGLAKSCSDLRHS